MCRPKTGLHRPKSGLHVQHHRQKRLGCKLISKHISAALASHQDVPTSSSNGAGGGKPRVMVIGVREGLDT